jgi:hypothetical protein
MTTVPTPVPWGEFSLDPRRPDAAALRASDRDREVVLAVLAEAYADGRLTKEEYDERADRAGTAKTLGELPGVIDDLVPTSVSSGARTPVTQDELRRQAVHRWQSQLRQALTGMLIPSLICWTIWLVTGFHGGIHLHFPWPVFVTLGTGANLLRVLLNKQDIVEQEVRRLERKQRSALAARKPRGGDR